MVRVASYSQSNDDECANFDAAIEVDRVLIGHVNAAGGYRLTHIFWLVGTVDAVQRVPAA
jgi:hypothetical protein